MKVSELIEMLGRCPPDYPVMIAYDCMVCIDDVEENESFIIHEGTVYRDQGVYLTTGCTYERVECGGLPIPSKD
jgi:hypothetical protein